MLNYIQILLLLGIISLLIPKRGIRVRNRNEQSIIVDSCGLIDGRIVDIISSGFLQGKIIIPEYILQELQLLADGHDPHKRECARRGLDVAKKLIEMKHAMVLNIKTKNSTTDNMLIESCLKVHAMLYTTDYNLNKIAALHQIRVLNIHELVGSLRSVVLPGEIYIVKVIMKGKERGQGLAYFEDGTMIVLENGAKYVGRKVEVTITRSLQSEAGKMLFATVNNMSREV